MWNFQIAFNETTINSNLTIRDMFGKYVQILTIWVTLIWIGNSKKKSRIKSELIFGLAVENRSLNWEKIKNNYLYGMTVGGI